MCSGGAIVSRRIDVSGRTSVSRRAMLSRMMLSRRNAARRLAAARRRAAAESARACAAAIESRWNADSALSGDTIGGTTADEVAPAGGDPG